MVSRAALAAVDRDVASGEEDIAAGYGIAAPAALNGVILPIPTTDDQLALATHSQCVTRFYFNSIIDGQRTAFVNCQRAIIHDADPVKEFIVN